MSADGRPGLEAAREAARGYGFSDAARLAPLHTGHVNESLQVVEAGRAVLLQWLNPAVFADVDAVQANVERALDHLAQSSAAHRIPSLERTPGGARHLRTEAGLWRAFGWLHDHATLARPDDPERARQAGRAFGAVAEGLADLAPGALMDCLEGFHDLDRRLDELEAARAGASPRRREQAAGLLDALDRRRPRWSPAPARPRERVVHGDTKFTNVLFPPHDGVGAAAVVVDFDTVMPGRLAWDLGDFLRSAASTGAEDDPDATAVDEAVLMAGAEGWLQQCTGLGRHADAHELGEAPARMAFVLAVRFAADHLRGDRYFRVLRPRHNLDRARAQLALADALLRGESRLRDLAAAAIEAEETPE